MQLSVAVEKAEFAIKAAPIENKLNWLKLAPICAATNPLEALIVVVQIPDENVAPLELDATGRPPIAVIEALAVDGNVRRN